METQHILLKNRYSVISLLGRGGMGEVFLAEDKLLSRQVAVKKVIYSNNEFLLKAAEKEAMVLARLQHHCLPKVLDYFNEDHAQYIVMEYIAGKNLGELLQINHAPFSTEQVLAWADNLMNILEYLHRQSPPVVHRDIKPQNIKITDEGKLFLLDFGLVKDTPTRVRSDSLSLSVYGYSQSYAPLEQINGDPTSVQTDVYELCATLYHLLTNVKPADALDRATKRIEHKPDSLRPAHEVNQSVPLGLSQILEAGLQLNCDERIKSVDALRQLLSQVKNKPARINVEIVDNESVKRDGIKPKPVTGRPGFMGSKRNRYAAIAAATVIFALIFLTGYKLVKGARAQKQFEEAQGIEHAEGILSYSACMKYKDIEANFLDSSVARDLDKKLNDCTSIKDLFQKAEKFEQDKGLNHETAAAYKEILEKFPGSAYDKQANKKVSEFETNKKATLRAWNEKQVIDESQIKDGLPSQYLRELAISYGKINLENVDPILVEHIKNSVTILNEGKALLDEIEPEIVKINEEKKQQVKEWCEKEHPFLTQWCISDWWEKNGEAFKQTALNTITTKYKNQNETITKRFNDITQGDDAISAQLNGKYKVEFIDRVKERLGGF